MPFDFVETELMIEWGLTEKEFDEVSAWRSGRIIEMRSAIAEGQQGKQKHQENLAKLKRKK